MFLETAGGTIHYKRFGEGPRFLVALPGYGENAAHFETLGALLGEEYSLLCPDLPLHGQTNWHSALDPSSFLDLIDQICQQEARTQGNETGGKGNQPGANENLATAIGKQAGTIEKQPGAVKKLTVLGYSMGARLWLSAYRQHPEKFEQLILVAPDGLIVNPWYWFATQTRVGNGVFRRTLANPAWFFKATQWAKKIKLLNESVFKFTHRFLDDPRQRQELYERWTFFRSFRSVPSETAQLVKNRQTPVLLLLGKYDRIITAANGKRWQAKAGPSCRLEILPAGHRLLQGPSAEAIAASILQNLRS